MFFIKKKFGTTILAKCPTIQIADRIAPGLENRKPGLKLQANCANWAAAAGGFLEKEPLSVLLKLG